LSINAIPLAEAQLTGWERHSNDHPGEDNRQQSMISRERRDRIKSVLIRYPALFRAVRATYIAYASAQRELFSLVRFAPRLIALRFGAGQRRSVWQRELPVQRPLRVDAGAVTPTLNPQQVKAWCSARHLPFFEGGDSIYLPPQTWRATPLAPVLPEYPADAGLKIAQQAGDADAAYVMPRTGRAVAQKLTFPHRLQILTFNYLHLEDIAPRLYDLIEIRDGSRVVWTAYVVQHVDSVPPQPGDCEQMTRKLRELERSGPLKLVSGAGWSGIDFQEPDCNGNLRRDAASGGIRYVDVHNFILEGYDAHLSGLAEKVAGTSHFGGRSRFLGGKSGTFLYQEIPGLDAPAKRSPRVRLQAWDPLLERAGVSIEGQTIFDIGCNLGLMGAEYLRRGARWLHGWDQPEVVEAARQVLLSIGCTRFSLTGGALGAGTDLVSGLPPHLRSVPPENAILSYLAIRGHIGWLPGLAKLPWRYMLYEGHQEDAELETYVSELNAGIPVRLLTTDRVSDGVSAPRDIALIERLSR
jgi:hypothetical protein